jgi:hypothetical protein
MYLPPRDADLTLWVLNFTTLLTATPTDFGLVAGDAVICAGPISAFRAALQLATDPSTRTKSTVAAKDAAKVTMLDVVRPYCIQIKNNGGVTDYNKIAIGVGVRDLQPTPVAVPNTQPLLSIVSATPQQQEVRYCDALTPDSRAKPFGVTALLLFCSVGAVPPVEPEASRFRALVTKQPYFQPFEVGDVGKTAFYYGRWVTRTGLLGPMSAVASCVIV